GDLLCEVRVTREGEYVFYLESQAEDGSFVQELVLCVYAVKEDLYRLMPYKGDFHMHSCCSDRKESPEYVAATCRKNGFDFMALTDHRQYAPSLTAKQAMADYGCDMLVCPGEEVHLPDNPVHIVHFGGKYSVNELAYNDEAKYRAGVAEYMKTIPESYDEPTRFQVAASEWTFDRIREAGGIAMFCHPYWRPVYHNYIGEDVNELLLEHNKFDVLEVVGGFYRHQTECNLLSISRWQEERAKGKKIPVAGISDCHGCDGDLAGWFYTIVFSEKLEFDSIAEAIRDERSVAVHCIPGEYPIVVGPFRLTRFVYFLLREFYPVHNELCKVEGEIMRRDIAGYGEPDAAAQIRSRSGMVQKYMEQFWGK
ncbi:MAG: PHP domain-containing protein, partial [Lentisphaeria bacterium]|nr:PHP domain-containing protein [Lentisphaeria bacterium]